MRAKSLFVRRISLVAVCLMCAVGVLAQTAELSSRNVRTQECRLGNVAVDALREASGAEIAWLPAAAFNEVTVSQDTPAEEIAARLLPYREDRIAVLRLTGAQIVQTLERALTLYPQPNAGFLQVSGLRVTFDPSKPPGERILRIQVGDQEIDPSQEYRVATSITLANGALGYFKIWERSAIERELDTTLGEALRRYLESGKPLAEAGERIVAHKP